MPFKFTIQLALFALLALFAQSAPAQKPAKPSSADIHQQIKKLNVLGSVLYVAAHPDDENQRFISYCANYKLYDVTYLSLTRGDGGQNLIGPELRELLGVLRSEELLMARSVDGGKQRFTRANDFGYSKNPEETLRIWNKDAVLGDVVSTIRQTQPDVVVNRFFHDKKYDTHGHHTASAMLSVEAFDLAGKADAYPEQLAFTKVWQPRRQYYNLSWWFFGGREQFAKIDKSNWQTIDGGVFLPLKGKSNSEVSAEARSMHRCQGFGEVSGRGENIEYFEFIKGDKSPDMDIFGGINTTWTRVDGGAAIGKLLAKIDAKYRSDNPAASVPDLLKAMQMIKALPGGFWRDRKLADIKEVIRGCLGLYLEATATTPTITPGDMVKIRLEAITRSPISAKSTDGVVLSAIAINPGLFDTLPASKLTNNIDWVFEKNVKIPDNAPFTAPYWLQKAYSNGMYTVDNPQLRGLPETPRYGKVRWSLTINGIPVEYETDIAYKYEEPAIGEVWRPFEVLPAAFVEFEQSAYMLPEKTKTVQVRVKAGRDKVSGTIQIVTPAGWSAVPANGSNAFDIPKKDEEKTIPFLVTGPDGASEATLEAQVEVNGAVSSARLVTIKYEHIPQQSILLPARTKAARVDLRVTAKNIGYYMGAGDDIPTALRQMGCAVTLLEDKDLTADNLRQYDAVVLGIRAYNTKQGLATHQVALFDYVRNGGNLVTQYNTNSDWVVPDNQVAPLPMKITRTRVTDEAAEVRFLLPEHAVLNTPNQLTSRDFEGWVQERGLYFAGEWDPTFAAPLSLNDPGEKPANGALLVANYGKGRFVYTSLSFFRELPVGVPGAYRLFANLISRP